MSEDFVLDVLKEYEYHEHSEDLQKRFSGWDAPQQGMFLVPLTYRVSQIFWNQFRKPSPDFFFIRLYQPLRLQTGLNDEVCPGPERESATRGPCVADSRRCLVTGRSHTWIPALSHQPLRRPGDLGAYHRSCECEPTRESGSFFYSLSCLF